MRLDYSHILKELKSHLPLSLLTAALGILVVVFLSYLVNYEQLKRIGCSIFHAFHPLHIMASSAATSSMYYSHHKDLFKSIILGIIGALVICSTSDILIPFLGGKIIKIPIEFHLCLSYHPLLIISFLIIGILCGILLTNISKNSTLYSHSSHVLFSTTASLFYLISYATSVWMDFIGSLFIIVIIAVYIPCCLSDIIFPLIFLGEEND
jgi:uncharacterized membrane protein YeaQ/YmgE (transglycosylase-associated protein family)